MLSYTLSVPITYLRTWPEKKITEQQEKMFNDLISRRKKGEPLAYILKTQEFWSLSFHISEDVLIPRPETELLVEIAIQTLFKRPPVTAEKPAAFNILDLGTGSGAIILSIAMECQKEAIKNHHHNRQQQPYSYHFFALDKSFKALQIAKHNAERFEIHNIDFICADWLDAFNMHDTVNENQKFQMIISNPPYIAENDQHLKEGDLPREPKTALIAGETGLVDLKNIINNAIHFLLPDGWLMVEHGYDQKDQVQYYFKQAGYHNIQSFKDFSGNDRVVIGCKKA